MSRCLCQILSDGNYGQIVLLHTDRYCNIIIIILTNAVKYRYNGVHVQYLPLIFSGSLLPRSFSSFIVLLLSRSMLKVQNILFEHFDPVVQWQLRRHYFARTGMWDCQIWMIYFKYLLLCFICDILEQYCYICIQFMPFWFLAYQDGSYCMSAENCQCYSFPIHCLPASNTIMWR